MASSEPTGRATSPVPTAALSSELDLHELGINIDDIFYDNDDKSDSKEEETASVAHTDIKGLRDFQLSPEDREHVMNRWKFTPLNVRVAKRCPNGHPQVLEAYPIEPPKHKKFKGKWVPQATLYWLVCPSIATQISVLEDQNWISRCQDDLRADPVFHQEAIEDHEWNTAQKMRLVQPDIEVVRSNGWMDMFKARGIGGIKHTVFKETCGIKCLHLHYAMHLVRPGGSAVGRWLDSNTEIKQCTS